MAFISWDSTFSVGVEILDEQHRKIIRLLNRIDSDPDADVRSETVSELLNDLVLYAREHFKTEEELMEKCGYPDFEKHKAMHKAYRVKVVSFCAETTSHQETVPQDLKEFLHDWWVDHILKVDMKYKTIVID